MNILFLGLNELPAGRIADIRRERSIGRFGLLADLDAFDQPSTMPNAGCEPEL